jgi:hypothetical protein
MYLVIIVLPYYSLEQYLEEVNRFFIYKVTQLCIILSIGLTSGVLNGTIRPRMS